MISELKIKTLIIKYKIFTTEAIGKITSLFNDIESEINNDGSGHIVEFIYEIKQGDYIYSGASFDEFNKQYETSHKADNIRIVMQTTDPSQQSNPVKSRITLELDRIQESSIKIAGENINWVNGVFTRFGNVLKEVPKRNVVLHNVIFDMSVQLLAVIVLTIFSVYLANKISALITINYSEVYIFVIVFLFLSNLWTYIGNGLTNIRTKYYPIVDVIKEPRKPIFLSIIIFLLLTTAAWAVNYVLNLLVTSPV